MRKNEITTYNGMVYGYELSDYAKENGYLDYRTLAKIVEDMILNNEIYSKGWKLGEWEQTNGYIDNSEEIEELTEELEELEELDEPTEEEQERMEEIEEKISELEEEQDNQLEIYQFYIISDKGADWLERNTDEIIFYHEELDIYLWGITHWGTSWDYVLTDLKLVEIEL